MLFDVTFSDGAVRTLQAHNREQLEAALVNVSIRKIIPSEQVSQEEFERIKAGMRDMEQSDTHELRKWARDLYGKADESTPEEAIALQCIIQTRIAEQLARIAEALEKISKRMEES